MSIKDNREENSFQVTMEMLKPNDTGTYWCGIQKFGTDRGTRIKVTVYPGKDFPVGYHKVLELRTKKAKKKGLRA